MGEITFNVGGRIMSESMVRARESTKRSARPASSAPASYHKGWTVEGFPRSEIDAARAEAEAAVSAWDAMSAEARAARMRAGERAPELWSEGRYVTTHKPKRVRTRPFEVVSAAEQMKLLAERSGWCHVRVVELKKGQPEAGGL